MSPPHSRPFPLSQKQRRVCNIIILCATFCFSIGSLFLALPVDRQGYSSIGRFFMPLVKLIDEEQRQDTVSISAQSATVTAVTQPGYDPGDGRRYEGVIEPIMKYPVNVADAIHLSRFYPGQCTYWANYRYHQLTGLWVPWLGNAYEWYYRALAYGWHTSSYPNPHGPSIIVLDQYVLTADHYGHVAVVEYDDGYGTVVTSNYNWGGAWAQTTYADFPYPYPGIHFIWA